MDKRKLLLKKIDCMSLREKTQAFWLVSNAFERGGSLTTGVAINLLSELECNIGVQRNLANSVTGLLDSVVEGKPTKRTGKRVNEHPDSAA